MKTILLEDFLDDGIIKEKSFREKINLMNFEIFSDEKVIIKGCGGTSPHMGLFNHRSKPCPSSRQNLFWRTTSRSKNFQ